MSLSKLKGSGLALVIILMACTATAFAQQSTPVQQEGTPGQMQREGRRGGGGPRRGHEMQGMLRGLRELNLTDAQMAQTRVIFERFAESTKPQREALQQLRGQPGMDTPSEDTRARAKQLRMEMRDAMRSARTEIAAVLTAEQRAKFEQMEQDRKVKHEERRERRRTQPEN